MTHPIIPTTPSDADYKAAPMGDSIEPPLSPFDLLAEWLRLARESEVNDPNAMCLATVDAQGMPDARMVLLKEYEDPHLGFYTNFDSAKGEQLDENRHAALVFHWKSLRRQVRVRGAISANTDEAADAYFATRSRKSQIGAIASKQSQPLPSRQALIDESAEVAKRYEGDTPITRPANWGGYLLRPLHFEFWQDQPYRLHDRVQYSWDTAQNIWQWKRLYP